MIYTTNDKHESFFLMMAKIRYDYNHLHFFLLITVHYLAIILYPNMVFGQYQSIIAGNTGIVQDSILAINAYCGE